MTLYTRDGSKPAPIPFRINLPDGTVRTDPETFTPREIEDAGYFRAYAAPVYDAATQHPPKWDGTKWIVTDKTAAELADEAAAQEAELINVYSQAIQQRLDSKAQERQYDNILSAVTYIGDPNPQFASEAEALRLWRSDTWATALVIMAEVQSGNRAPPSIDALFAELPTFSWP